MKNLSYGPNIIQIVLQMVVVMELKNRQRIFTGQVITLDTGQVDLPNGCQMQAEIVSHPGGAAVVALNESNELCLLKQYRCVFDQWLWELPAGKIDNKEAPIDTARRELKEEAGLSAGNFESLGSVISSPGVFSETVYLYLATGLQSVQSAVEDTEVFEIHWISLDSAVKMAQEGVISDGKTLVGIFRAIAQNNLKSR